jgi:hypothetical protein
LGHSTPQGSISPKERTRRRPFTAFSDSMFQSLQPAGKPSLSALKAAVNGLFEWSFPVFQSPCKVNWSVAGGGLPLSIPPTADSDALRPELVLWSEPRPLGEVRFYDSRLVFGIRRQLDTSKSRSPSLTRVRRGLFSRSRKGRGPPSSL